LQRITRFVAPYAAALTVLALITAITIALLHTAFPRPLYGFIFVVLALGTAWWGSYGPGIFIAVMIMTVAPYFVTPGFNLSKVNVTQLVQLVLTSVLVSRVASTRNQREAVLRESNELLDERVRRRTQELEQANASLHERENLLLRQADELARSNTDLQQFAYVASHDLQEPLRLIAIYTELLKRRYGGQIDSEADRFLGVIIDGVRRMETLIRDLLSYSRVIHAGTPAEKEYVDPAEALKIAAANLELVIRETGATIHWSDLPRIRGDRLELTQVFQNLLGNALKYRSDAPPRVEVRATANDAETVFRVEDNGIGIHPDFHDAVFTPFKRLHGREYPGTGIGLALCRRIVERHGGRIWVESEPGKGAAFVFSIPHPAGAKQRAAEFSGSSSGRA
jgi:light-regulated signal transduction histidine kinase (bacteriophytochrome)